MPKSAKTDFSEVGYYIFVVVCSSTRLLLLFCGVCGHRSLSRLCCIASLVLHGALIAAAFAWGDGVAVHVVDISFVLLLATTHLLLFLCKAGFGNFWRHLNFFLTVYQMLLHLTLVNLVDVRSAFVGLFLKSQLDFFLIVAEQFLHWNTKEQIQI